LQEFFQHLRTNPKFFYKTPDELLNAYRAMTRRIDPELVKVFRTLPRTPYGVIPIPTKSRPTRRPLITIRRQPTARVPVFITSIYTSPKRARNGK
jgi:uncharacterized protein (DUF885 family)